MATEEREIQERADQEGDDAANQLLPLGPLLELFHFDRADMSGLLFDVGGGQFNAWRGLELREIVLNRFFGIQPDLTCIGSQKAAGEDATGKRAKSPRSMALSVATLIFVLAARTVSDNPRRSRPFRSSVPTSMIDPTATSTSRDQACAKRASKDRSTICTQGRFATGLRTRPLTQV